MSKFSDSFMIDIQEHKTVCHKPQKSLLESIEANQIEVHYHCREGYCGACRTKLLAGEVAYQTDPLAFIDDDEILPCCCYPISDIKIELG